MSALSLQGPWGRVARCCLATIGFAATAVAQAAPTVEEALALEPRQTGVDFDRPGSE